MKTKALLFTLILTLYFSHLRDQVKDHAVYTEGKPSAYEKRKLRQSLSREDGVYFIAQAGLRRHLTTAGNNLYLPISGEMDGIIQGGIGYRINNISLESGIGFSWHNSDIPRQLGSSERILITQSNLNSIFIPLGLRYDIPVNSKKSIRFGANASGNLIIHTTNKPSQDGSFPYYGSNSSEGVQVDFSVSEPSLKTFFKVGLHTEFQIFKSSFLIIQGSHMLSAPNDLRTISYTWQDGSQSGSFENQISMEGWVVEVAYKLPLSILRLEK